MHQEKLIREALQAEQKRIREDADRAQRLPTSAARLQMMAECNAQMELLNRLVDRIPKSTDFTGLKEGE